MADSSRLIRHWLLLQTLSARRHGVTVRELADDHGTSEKTIRRDLLLLKRFGFPVEETDTLGARGLKSWRIAENTQRPPLAFNPTEAAALYLGRQFLAPFAGTQLGDAADSAFKKLRATFGDVPLKYLEKIARTFHQTGGHRTDYSSKSDVLDTLQFACEERRITHLSYRSLRSTETITREVHPLTWTRHRDAIYLVAFAPDHQAIRTYKLDRIDTAEATPLQFTTPANFNIADYLSGAWGIYRDNAATPTTVRIRFPPEVARVVQERTFHPSQKLTPQPDGSLLAQFKLTDLIELKSWLLSFGPNALVLEPQSLRDEIQSNLRATLQAYETTATPAPKGPSRKRSVPKRKG